MVGFAVDGQEGRGRAWLATPEHGAGPGVVVIQEWWGLVDHVTDVCDRLAAEGFTAMAPDLFGGRTVDEPGEAEKVMMSLNLEWAARDLSGAVDHLAGSDQVRGHGVGVVGFCMGGGLALVLATQRPDQVKACVPYYGFIPWPGAQPAWSRLDAAVQGHFAEDDDLAPPAAVAELEGALRALGKDVEIFTYPGTHHAFFNDDRPEVHDPAAASAAWTRTIEHLRAKLG